MHLPRFSQLGSLYLGHTLSTDAYLLAPLNSYCLETNVFAFSALTKIYYCAIIVIMENYPTPENRIGFFEKRKHKKADKIVSGILGLVDVNDPKTMTHRIKGPGFFEDMRSNDNLYHIVGDKLAESGREFEFNVWMRTHPIDNDDKTFFLDITKLDGHEFAGSPQLIHEAESFGTSSIIYPPRDYYSRP